MEELNEYLNETPIVVKFWETELDRDEGLSEIYGYYPESQKAEAIQAGKKLMHRMDYACVEVYNEETEETYYWTDGVTEDYFDNKNESDMVESKSHLNEDENYILDDINTDLAEFLFDEIFEDGYIDNEGRFNISAEDYPDLDWVHEVYDDEISEQEFNNILNIIKSAINNSNLKFYQGDNGTSIELSDNHTLWDINLPEDAEFDYDEYNVYVQNALDDFASDTGTQVYLDGRSGRHVCVPVNLSNIIYYDKLVEKQKAAEKQLITDIESLYNTDIKEESKQTDIAANKFGLKANLNKLEQDLMNIKYVTKVDYDLSGYYDNINGPITLVSYDIPNTEVTTRNYLAIKKDLKTQVLDVMKNNGVNVELEEFEDNDTYFYIVAYSTNWDKVVKEEKAVNNKTKLTFAYKDNGQFYYKDKNGKVYVDMSPLKDKIDLYRCVGDYDEPANSVNVEEFELINNPKDNINYDRNKNYESDYMLLGRLVQDCKYYLGNGNRFDGNLWAGSVDKQIAKMKELWNKFPEDMKPEWLSMEDIENYEKEMTTEKKTERRVLGEYKSIKKEKYVVEAKKNYTSMSINDLQAELTDVINAREGVEDGTSEANELDEKYIEIDGILQDKLSKIDNINMAESFNELLDILDTIKGSNAVKARQMVSHAYTHLSDEEEMDKFDDIKDEVMEILTENSKDAWKPELEIYQKLINGIKENLNINEHDIQIDENVIKFRYNDNVYFAEPCSMYQVNIFDGNHNQIGWGVLVNEIKEEVFTEYTNDDYLYQLVGGKYAGTYTREEAGDLPILEPELTGENTGRRKELQKQLQFKGYLGPMWNGTKDGKAIIRYETQEVYDMLSENKLVEETDKEMYKRIKEEPRTEKYEQGLKLRDEIVTAWKNKDLETANNKWSELFDLFSTGYDDNGNKTSEWTEEQSMRDMIELNMITHTIEDKCVYDVCDYGKAKAYKEMGY